LRATSVLILSDDREFARLLTACWQVERQTPELSLVTSDFWSVEAANSSDLVVIGPLHDGKLLEVLRNMPPSAAVILCAPSDARELGALRKKYPRLLHVPLREDWTQVVLLVAGESLRRAEALRLAQKAEQRAAQNASQAVLGRYMVDMRHNLNNAMTSLLGNAELLLLEPGRLTTVTAGEVFGLGGT